VTHLRPYRNFDTPALADLWNRVFSGAGPAVARPLSAHEFDARVVGGPLFEAAGLIVAERDGRLVGFAHAGFGPADPTGPPLRLSHALGAVAMLAVAPEAADPALEDALLAEAERYLRRRGAGVVYAGGQPPLNPFYWGVYGGSEGSGVLDSHPAFRRAVARAGFEPVATTVLLEADLSAPERRDPRGVLIRRQTRLDVDEDPLPSTWWEALAVGEFRLTTYRLVSRPDELEVARATTWDMSWFGRADGRPRVGLSVLEVHPEHRRKGYGRFLVQEVLRSARAQSAGAVAVQTGATNAPALALYAAAGFEPVETAVLYRLPGGAGAGVGQGAS
jgi:ribosomal protein S18 acetylase RimI-like enzyme